MKPIGILALILVALSVPVTAAAADRPLLLIHGIASDHETWDRFVEDGKSRYGWTVAPSIDFRSGGMASGATAIDVPRADVYTLDFSSPDGLTLREQGEEVGRAIESIRSAWGGDAKVFLVGHSMGGLAARAWLGFHDGEHVAGVVTLGTPHAGSPLAVLAAFANREEKALLHAGERFDVADFVRAAAPGMSRETRQQLACMALAEAATLLRLDPDSKGVRLLDPESAELVALNALPPPDVPFANIVFRAPRRTSDRLVPALTGLVVFLAEFIVGKEVQSPIDEMFSDGVVPVSSQSMRRLALAPYGNALYADMNLNVSTGEAFHVAIAPGAALRVRAEGVVDGEIVAAQGVEGETSQSDLIFESLQQVGWTAPVARDRRTLTLVLDSSQSMEISDPSNLRTDAAKILVERLAGRAAFTVVDFDSTARVLVRESEIRAETERALNVIDAEGGTRLCEALRVATQNVTPGRQHTFVVFSDGKSEDRCDGSSIAAAGARAFTIGLSSGADGAFLQSIALSANGAYFHAKAPADLPAIFDAVVREVLDEATIIDVAGMVRPGKSVTISVPVDASFQSMQFLLTWPGSDLDLSLRAPDGTTFVAGRDGVTGRIHEALTIDRPAPGLWSAEVRAVDVPPGGEPFRFRAGGGSPVRIAIRPSVRTPWVGNPLEIAAELHGFRSMAGAKFAAAMTTPDNRRIPLALTLLDGVLRAVFDRTLRSGPYALSLSAADGDVQRSIERTFFVGGPDLDPRVGDVTRVEGQYLAWNRGRTHGIAVGMKVQVCRGSTQIGTAQVIAVRDAESDVELMTVDHVAEVVVGDCISVSAEDWRAVEEQGTVVK